jgi:hypothetical protein
MKQTLLLLLALICINAKAATAEPHITMTTVKNVGDSFEFKLAATTANTVVQVDFGNGTLVDKTIGVDPTYVSGICTGTLTIKIYGANITYLDCNQQHLSSLDVTRSTALTYLNCSGNLISLLKLNTALKQLVCSSNHLTSLDVKSNTGLTELWCSNNYLSSLDVKINTALTMLDCSTNSLSVVDVTSNTALIKFWCSSCQLTSLNVTANTALTDLYCNNNKLTSLNITNNSKLSVLYCYSNQLTYATLPLVIPAIRNYAPQQPITIASAYTINTPIDLSSQLIANGITTLYTWKTDNDTPLTAGTDYTISGGITTFIKAPSAKVYCEMTNANFPDMSGGKALKTTLTSITTITAAEEPKASAVNIYTRNQTVYLSLPEAAMIQVYDITGHLVKAQTCNSGTNSFEVPQKGIFVVKVNMDNQTVTRKIVIK